MSLIKCPECSREISDLAPACPQCGMPRRPPALPVTAAPTSPPPLRQVKRRNWDPKGALIALLLVGVIGGCFYFVIIKPASGDHVYTAEPAQPAAPRPVAKLSAEIWDGLNSMVEKGWLTMKFPLSKAWVTPDLWLVADAQQKENLTRNIATACAERNGWEFSDVTILDKQSGRVLATLKTGWLGAQKFEVAQ